MIGDGIARRLLRGNRRCGLRKRFIAFQLSYTGDYLFPRRFALVRRVDYTGVSGVGVVAYGVVFSDGHVALRWVSSHPATSMWNSLDDLIAVHGHDDATTVQWIDQASDILDDLAGQTSQRPRRARRDPLAQPDQENEPLRDEASRSMNGSGPPASGKKVPLTETAPMPKSELPRQPDMRSPGERTAWPDHNPRRAPPADDPSPEPESSDWVGTSERTGEVPLQVEAPARPEPRNDRRSGRHRKASRPIDFDMAEQPTSRDSD